MYPYCTCPYCQPPARRKRERPKQNPRPRRKLQRREKTEELSWEEKAAKAVELYKKHKNVRRTAEELEVSLAFVYTKVSHLIEKRSPEELEKLRLQAFELWKKHKSILKVQKILKRSLSTTENWLRPFIRRFYKQAKQQARFLYKDKKIHNYQEIARRLGVGGHRVKKWVLDLIVEDKPIDEDQVRKEYKKLKNISKVSNKLEISPYYVRKICADLVVKKKTLSFPDARRLMRKQAPILGITSGSAYRDEKMKAWRDEHGLPVNVELVYKNKGWAGWADFLNKPRRLGRKWLPFEKALTLVRGQNFKRKEEYVGARKWRDLNDLPTAPENTYKDQWGGWYHFLGNIKPMRRKPQKQQMPSFATLEEAQRIISRDVKSLGITSSKAYRKAKAWRGKHHLPYEPEYVYKEDWPGWDIFLGKPKSKNINWTPFLEARHIVRQKKFKSGREYWKAKTWRQTHKLPYNAHEIYKDQGWSGWDDFLGKPKSKFKNWPSYEEAKKLVAEAGFTRSEQYEQDKAWRKKHTLPSEPAYVYKDQGWSGWNDFLLSTYGPRMRKRLARPRRVSWPIFAEAQKLVREVAIASKSDYGSKRKQLGLPSEPYEVYKDSWSGWKDFLGYTTQRYSPKKHTRSFEEVRKVVRREAPKKQIASRVQYRKEKAWRQKFKLPPYPETTYLNRGWAGWDDFLNKPKSKGIQWVSLEQAKKLVRERGLTSAAQLQKEKQWRRQVRIPSSPDQYYADLGWTGWDDFFGKPKSRFKDWPTFEEAKRLVIKAGITSQKQYRLAKAWRKQHNLPFEPENTYKNKGWLGYRDFFKPRKRRNPRPRHKLQRREVAERGYRLSSLAESQRMDLYNQGLTDTAIARELGMPSNTITVWRRKKGLPPNRLVRPYQRYYDLGYSDKQIADAVGVSRKSVLQWRRSLSPQLPKNVPWARLHTKCNECGSNRYPHQGKGVCQRCVERLTPPLFHQVCQEFYDRGLKDKEIAEGVSSRLGRFIRSSSVGTWRRRQTPPLPPHSYAVSCSVCGEAGHNRRVCPQL